MKTYILDIIPKIQRYSRKLDDLTILLNKHWVIFDEILSSKSVYIFRANKELLISNNGKVKKAKWDYVGTSALLIDVGDESYLFKHGFFNEDILALKLDGKDEYALLINESSSMQELNSVKSIVEFLSNRYLEQDFNSPPKITSEKTWESDPPKANNNENVYIVIYIFIVIILIILWATSI